MKTKLCKLLFTLFFILGFYSCSTDSNESGFNLPNETKAFIGLWKSTESKTLVFFEDGTCWYYDYRVSSTDRNEGTWAYDPSTKILATTLNQQWQVTLSNNNNWVGNDINNHASYTFKKVNDSIEVYKTILPATTWSNKEKESLRIIQYTSRSGQSGTIDGFVAQSENFYFGQSHYSGRIHNVILKAIDSFNFDIYETDLVGSYYRIPLLGNATITLSYKSPQEIKMQLTGKKNRTLTIVTNENE